MIHRTGHFGDDWPAYTLPRRATMIFNVIPRVADDPRRWQRELSARAPYIQPRISTCKPFQHVVFLR